MIYCIWCNREFKKSSLFYSFFSSNPPPSDILFHDSFECDFCNPKLPITWTNPNNDNDIITIINVGSHIDLDIMQLTKPQTTKPISHEYLYPVDYCISRRCRSYLYKSYTNVKCEILLVDENYFQKPYSPGTKDVLLFRAVYEDDPNNPLEVIENLYHMAPLLKQRYRTQSPATHYLFGLDCLYIQYLIKIRVENAERFGPPNEDILIQLLQENYVLR